ncbi:MAG: hypothetical protein D8M56_09560 [Chloroflexi bacterium]|nr:hypothetical protein [Chloroflexota bacterium]
MAIKFIAGLMVTIMGGIGLFAPHWLINLDRSLNPFSKHFPNTPSAGYVKVLGFCLFVGGLLFTIRYDL